jgi:Gluconate 2-dehydrogenase subunit 3
MAKGLAPSDPARQRDLTKGHHLPNLRPGRQPPHPNWLPRQRRGTTPQMVGRYPDYDVLETAGTWDEATRAAVMGRLSIPSRLAFFSAAEEPTLRAFCDRCMAQDCEPRIPVAEMVDQKLAAGRLDGYQYADMPDDRETWHLVLAGLDEAAGSQFGQARFAELGIESQKTLIGRLAQGQLSGGSWARLNVARAWSVCMRMILAAFYSHPWAWNEIGFGGPAYPRGFMRLGPVSTREPFERPPASNEDPVREDEEP